MAAAADASAGNTANRKNMLRESRRAILNRRHYCGREISRLDPAAFRRDDENRIRAIFVAVLICPCVPPRLKCLIEILRPDSNTLIEVTNLVVIVPIEIAEEKGEQ